MFFMSSWKMGAIHKKEKPPGSTPEQLSSLRSLPFKAS